jgi:hypothetical protein
MTSYFMFSLVFCKTFEDSIHELILTLRLENNDRKGIRTLDIGIKDYSYMKGQVFPLRTIHLC